VERLDSEVIDVDRPDRPISLCQYSVTLRGHDSSPELVIGVEHVIGVRFDPARSPLRSPRTASTPRPWCPRPAWA
jgi:hypothetical protein